MTSTFYGLHERRSELKSLKESLKGPPNSIKTNENSVEDYLLNGQNKREWSKTIKKLSMPLRYSFEGVQELHEAEEKQ